MRMHFNLDIITHIQIINEYSRFTYEGVFMVTLKDIAKEAGVSVMMVSRVINKRFSEVSEENIAKIQEISTRLGYVPNSSARSLSSKSSRIISIIIQGSENPLESPYNAAMLGQIIQEIQGRGYNSMVHFVIDKYSEVTQHLKSWKAEGAIFLGTFDKDIQQIQADNQIPLVFTDSYSSIRQITNIGIDDYKGGVLAARHLIENGHRHFAFVAPHLNTSQLIQQRLKGYSDTIQEAGFTLLPSHIIDMHDLETNLEILCSSQQPITAIFAATDCCAVTLIDLLRQKNYQVPEYFSIIGFDNLPICQYTTPRLTTISQDIRQKAQYASDILFQHLQNDTLPTQNVIMDVKLISRESVRKLV